MCYLVKTQAERYVELPSIVFDLLPYILLLGEEARKQVCLHMRGMVRLVKTSEVNAYSNMTVWELKKLAAIKFQVSPLSIQLQRHDSKISTNTSRKMVSSSIS